MSFFPDRQPSPGRVRAARAVGILTDLIQAGGWLLFPPGLSWFFDDVMDVLAAAVLFFLVGWHWTFLPSFLTKFIPLADVVPTWTAAVFIATWKKSKPAAPPGVIETKVVR